MSRLTNGRFPEPRSRIKASRLDIGFGLIFSFGAILVLAIWAAVGFGLYSVITDPDGTGRFVGRIVGGAISGAQEGR